MLIILLGSGRFWMWLRTISAKSTGRLRGIHSPRSKAAITPRNQEFAASGVDLKKHASVKGSNHPKKSRICCHRCRPEETRLGQRQQTPQEIKNLLPPALTRRSTSRSKAANTPRNQDFAASVVDPKKGARVKGSNHPKKSKICSLRRRPEETCLGQRQQSSQEIKNLPPPPLTRRNQSRSKAAIIPRNQEFAASAIDAKGRVSVKGSKHPKKSRFCCLCRRPEERRVGQRQQSPQEIKNLQPPASTRRSIYRRICDEVGEADGVVGKRLY